MRERAAVILCLILIFAAGGLAAPAGVVIKTDVVTISLEQQYEAVKPGGKSA